MQKVLEILRVQPNFRKLEDKETVIRETADIPFFKKYIDDGEKEIHINSCNAMRHLQFQKNEVVF